ncbi:MFS transporter [Flavihumibacter stibioxidans]|uniref:MFS transporter n=1 Tax=Flavihumibacter stibioxidans TaxID=1834163 RepID=A0ABR7MBX6_9BACT|nr:MFS transporter [Flavihumibacter stibioxidans]MBC6492472.1 MFS transporter [Flavihumibacter stibioxidans]
MTQTAANRNSVFNIAVIVAALGYFVDIYDLLLFSIIRVPSLQDLGLSEVQIRDEGLFIINTQMMGLLIGGILWGVLADKKGRLSVLFASIIMYSLGNIANGFVQTVNQYAAVRFISGIGLAGELGAGITLVSELLHKDRRGIGTSLVAGIGLSGAVLAYFMKENFHWRTCYFIGGGLGFMLLFLRIKVAESGMFHHVKQSNIKKGNFLMFFNNANRFRRYLLSILIGLPTWFVIGILVSFSKEFAIQMDVQGTVDPGKAVMYAYVGISLGDIAVGLVSQLLKSRKKALFLFYGLTIIGMFWFFNLQGADTQEVYWACALLGFGTGFWAIFVTMAAEQFGTNLRATAATTVPNMVRGSLNLITLLFTGLQAYYGFIQSGVITAVVIMIITFISAALTAETFGKDLNYVEE